jgi:predicted secreted protein
MPRAALALALLAACGAPVVQPLSEAKRREPDKAVPKDSKADATPAEPAPPPPPRANDRPWTRPGDAATQTDDLTFWGWSRDGQRYAFEVHDHGPGAARCEGKYVLYVVDATRDAFVDGTPLEIKHRSPGDERCDPPDLESEIERHRPELLHRHGIVVGHLRQPALPARVTTTTGAEKHPAWTLALGAGAPVRAEVETIGGGRDRAGDPGAAFKLTLTRGDDPPLALEKGERKRPFVWAYGLDGGAAFVSPDGGHLAVITAVTQLSFEGDRHTFMSNGAALPAAWRPTPAP